MERSRASTSRRRGGVHAGHVRGPRAPRATAPEGDPRFERGRRRDGRSSVERAAKRGAARGSRIARPRDASAGLCREMHPVLADRGSRRGSPRGRLGSRVQESARPREGHRHEARVDRGGPRSRGQDAHGVGTCDEPGPGIGAKLHEQVADVVRHGLPAHPESLCDLPARHPERDQPEHPKLGRGDPPNRSQQIGRLGVGVERRLMSDHAGLSSWTHLLVSGSARPITGGLGICPGKQHSVHGRVRQVSDP